MVPVVGLSGPAAQDNTPPNTLPMEFPSWTRADDNDGVPDTISTQLRRRARMEDAQSDNKRDDLAISATATTLLSTRIENRGFIKDIAEPVISGIFNAFGPDKHGSEPDSSDDDKKKGKAPKPDPVQTDLPLNPTPELPSPTSPASPASPTFPPLPPPPPPPTTSNPGNPINLPTTTYKPVSKNTILPLVTYQTLEKSSYTDICHAASANRRGSQSYPVAP